MASSIPALAAAGYRVVAIDQRGYGRSSKYRVQSAYRIEEMVVDVLGVIETYGEKMAAVIGHDSRAPVAWTFAWLLPDGSRRCWCQRALRRPQYDRATGKSLR